VFISLARVLCFSLGKEAYLPRVSSLPRVYYFALGKAFFAESFLFGSQQRTALQEKPLIPVVICICL
jgi:hypothetical protein